MQSSREAYHDGRLEALQLQKYPPESYQDMRAGAEESAAQTASEAQ